MNITEIMHNLENTFGLIPLRSTYLYRNGHITEMPNKLQYSWFNNSASSSNRVKEFLISKSYRRQYGQLFVSESLPEISISSFTGVISLGDNLERMLFSNDIQDSENLIIYLQNKVIKLKNSYA
jgi:hypothetical protein